MFAPLYARAPRNERAHDRAPFNKGDNLTTLAVLTTGGLAAAMTLAGAADARAVAAFVRELVVPLLRPGQVLVLDNVATHKGAPLRRLVEGAGCRLCFLPAYSPDRRRRVLDHRVPDGLSSCREGPFWP